MDRLSRLDGLRGVLAVYVMLGHAMPFTTLPAWLTGPFNHGEAAVDLFFALSGLVVFNSLEQLNYAFWPFVRGRARRLLPVYFAVLALAVALICLGSPLTAMPWIQRASAAGHFWAIGLPHLFLWHILAHVTLTNGILPQGVLPWAYISVLGPAWSLSTEWQFYIVMALVMARMKGSRRLVHFAYAMVFLGIGYRGIALFLPASWQFSRAFLPEAAPYFGLGLASAVWMRSRNPIPSLFCLAAACILGFISAEPWKALTPFGWAIALLAQRNPHMAYLPKLLDSRAAQYLGAVSYPLYLLNEPVQRGCAMLIAPISHNNPALFTMLWLPAAVTLPVLAAILLHHGIETPFMKWTRVDKPAHLAPLPAIGNRP